MDNPAIAKAAPASSSVSIRTTTNFLTIQVLRAIAALMVVAYHAFDMWAVRITQSSGEYWTNGAAGVDIFFIISGFVMVVSSRRLLSEPRAWLTFMRHRIVRIVPLYWLLTTLKLVLVFFFAGLALRSSLDLDYVFRSYLFLPVVDDAGHFRPLLPVGWTLTYEFLFYGLFTVALALRSEPLRVLIPAFAIIVALALLRSADWPDWTILFNTIVVEFLFGVILAKLTMRGLALPPALAVASVVVGFVLICSFRKARRICEPSLGGYPRLLSSLEQSRLRPGLGTFCRTGCLLSAMHPTQSTLCTASCCRCSVWALQRFTGEPLLHKSLRRPRALSSERSQAGLYTFVSSGQCCGE